jgi:hypothetical protein
MLKWLIRRKLGAFERQHGYDLTYAREILETDFGAFMRLGKITNALAWHRDVPLDVYYGVKLAGVIAEDCGPCSQLVVSMALADKVDPNTIAAIVAGDHARAGELAALGMRFALAARAHDPAADEPRADIERRWGKRAVVSVAFALSASRFFPTFKYALGYGKACQRIDVAGTFVQPGVILAS